MAAAVKTIPSQEDYVVTPGLIKSSDNSSDNAQRTADEEDLTLQILAWTLEFILNNNSSRLGVNESSLPRIPATFESASEYRKGFLNSLYSFI
jgi:hypothetical protein